jgi:dihydrolipoamide dehydrogenase
MKEYDLIIIGAGPGGYVAAERAGEHGLSVLLIEKGELGGVCTNEGCIPTKSLLNAAKLYTHAKDSEPFGVTAQGVSFDLSAAMAWKQETMKTLRTGIAGLMKKSKVEVITGEAELLGDTKVSVNGESYVGKDLIIATGSSPVIPPIPGADKPHVLTSTQMLEIEKIPEQLVVVGGGVIGVEFASMFSQVGSEVTVIEMMDEILPMMDADIAKQMKRAMKQVSFKTGSTVRQITDTEVVYTDSKGREQRQAADVVLMSVGRRPNSAGCEHIGLSMEQGAILVDEYMRTNIAHVYAAGDVNGKSLLAHSASRMAEVAVSHILGGSQVMRYQAVPWAVYTQPEAAGCGITEQQAQEQGREVKVASMPMRANGRFLAEHGKKAPGLCKIIADKKSGMILGVHMIGAVSSEMIYGAAAFIEAELRVQDVSEIIFPHPSVSEVIKDLCTQLT